MQRTASLLWILLLALGTSGCRPPEQDVVFKSALVVARSADTIPPGAQWPAFEEARIFIGKNAARVDLPYSLVPGTTSPPQDSYSVWFRRVARTWTVEAHAPTPPHGTPTADPS